MSDRLRVYELARELGLSSKEMLSVLADEGIEVKSHASTIDEDLADLVRDHVIGNRRKATASFVESLGAGEDAEPPAEDAADEQAGGDEEEAEDEAEDEELTDGDRGSKTEIHLKPPITVRDLAKALGRKPNEVIGALMAMNVFATINQVIEPDAAEKICAKYGLTFVRERRERKGAKRKDEAPAQTAAAVREAPAKRIPVTGHLSRPPVVAFLGHVDHGKTSLLDAIRQTQVATGEAGGITQHIGASCVQKQGKTITFLDTPGHEAFTAMRARGANATDLVVLVVAADDGVMPQTVEAINHAKAADVPLIVAMNKIDLPTANPDKVLMELQRNGVMAEDWGGQVGVVPVSAMTGQGIDDLLDRILLEAEVMELKANPSLPCEGLIIEAQLEPGMGATASVLVRNGSLQVGDAMLCGACYGKVKALIDQGGTRVASAGPSTPVKVLGLSGVPDAGEILSVLEDEREAKQIAESRAQKARQGALGRIGGEPGEMASLDDLFRQITEGARQQLPIIVKADVRGSLEAIIDALKRFKSEKVEIDVIHDDVGEITNNDVLLAAASNAIVIGFHVRAMPGVNKTAKQNGVEIRLYSIIYELLEDIEEAMLGKLKPELREHQIGTAAIKEIFDIGKTGRICGCIVNSGVVRTGSNARVVRDGDIIYNGSITSLKHFKDNVREVRSGQECGIQLDNFEDFEVGDEVRAFEVEQVAPQL